MAKFVVFNDVGSVTAVNTDRVYRVDQQPYDRTRLWIADGTDAPDYLDVAVPFDEVVAALNGEGRTDGR